jgi:hypothetical protein
MHPVNPLSGNTPWCIHFSILLCQVESAATLPLNGLILSKKKGFAKSSQYLNFLVTSHI